MYHVSIALYVYLYVCSHSMCICMYVAVWTPSTCVRYDIIVLFVYPSTQMYDAHV